MEAHPLSLVPLVELRIIEQAWLRSGCWHRSTALLAIVDRTPSFWSICYEDIGWFSYPHWSPFLTCVSMLSDVCRRWRLCESGRMIAGRLILIAVLVVVAVGCGQPEDESAERTTSTMTEQSGFAGVLTPAQRVRVYHAFGALE